MPTLEPIYKDLLRLKDISVKLFDEHAYVSEGDVEVAHELLIEAEGLVKQLAADYDGLTKTLSKTRG